MTSDAFATGVPVAAGDAGVTLEASPEALCTASGKLK
jgi:hypothetical protein